MKNKVDELLSKPLDQKELTELSNFLISPVTPATCMNIEGVDGFFSALVCSPVSVPSQEWLPVLWGTAQTDDDHDVMFRSGAERKWATDALTRYWNSVEKKMKTKEVVEPLLFEKGIRKDVHEGQHWAQGFLIGMRLRSLDWYLLIDDRDLSPYSIVPILSLASGRDPDNIEQMLPADRRAILIEMLPSIISVIYEFWHGERSAWRLRAVDAINQNSNAGATEPLH